MIRNPFKKKIVEHTYAASRPEPITYNIRSGWGVAIDFNDYETGSETQRVYGFEPLFSAVGKPHLDDLLKSKMKSGYTAIWKFISVEWCHDPNDMWLGKVKFVRYE